MRKVITYGTFDLLHEGHRQILINAKKLGDYLIVGVTSDYFDLQRGKMNVEQSLVERIENIRKSGLADEIIVEEHEAQKITDIQKYGVHIFAIGSDWRGKFDFLNEYCEVVYLERTPDISSTSLRDGHYGIVRLGSVGMGGMTLRQLHELKFVSGVRQQSIFDPGEGNAQDVSPMHPLRFTSSDYDAFLEEVDAVYIASNYDTRYGYAQRALRAGKHVLCECPIAFSAREAKDLFDLASKKKVVLMEAIRTAYAPGFINLLAVAKNGRIGEIKDVEVAVTKLLPKTSIEFNRNDYRAGSFIELAGTTLLPIIKILGVDYSDVNFVFFTNEDNVDLYTKAYFRYSDSIATSKTGIGVKSEGQLLISGTKGYILVKSPWWLTKAFEVCYENPEENEHFSAPFPGYGMRFELSDFVRNTKRQETKNYQLSRSDSVAIASIMEKFLAAKQNNWGNVL